MATRKPAAARVMVLAALALLLQLHWASTVVTAGGTGRDLATCIQICGSIKNICQSACEIDCAALFPPGGERSACVVSCKEGCLDEMQTCKAKCNVKRKPPTGVEP